MLTLPLTGALKRFGVLTLNESFSFISSDPALVLFGVATAPEIAVDEVPVLDHGLDVVSTFIRPRAGASVAADAMHRADSPLFAAILGIMVGAPIAMEPRAARANMRAASMSRTAGVATR